MKSKHMGLLIFIIVTLLIIFFLIKHNQTKELDLLEVRKNIITEDLQQIEEERDKVEQYQEYMKSKEYIEDIARKKLGLAYPDEIIFEPEN